MASRADDKGGPRKSVLGDGFALVKRVRCRCAERALVMVFVLGPQAVELHCHDSCKCNE
jgi:hypothetical protein